MTDNIDWVKLSFDSDAAELRFMPGKNILVLYWKNPVSSLVIRAVYESLLLQMQQKQIKHILIDVRDRGRASYQDEIWMARQFIPRLIKIFDQGIYSACLVSPEHYRELQLECRNKSLESLSELFCLNHFLTIAEALTWLQAKKTAAKL